MSNRRGRTRTAGRSYTARLRAPAAAPPRRVQRAPGRDAAAGARLATGARLASGWPPAVLAAGAEAGHLYAAWLEWPGTPWRGIGHTVAAAALGVVAATVYFGLPPRRAAAALGVVASIPVLSLAATLAGASPYAAGPLPVAALVTTAEIALAGLLVLAVRRDTS